MADPKTCECGCGRVTRIVAYNDPAQGLVKGEYRRWCRGHHRRVAHNCSVDACSRAYYGDGFCKMHYQRARRLGGPGAAEQLINRTEGHSLIERFWAKVEKTDTCWNWIGGTTSDGYGQFAVGDRTVRAHRYAYEMMVGPIPEDLHIDHLCVNASCVNPVHMEPVTSSENSIRAHQRRGHTIHVR